MEFEINEENIINKEFYKTLSVGISLICPICKNILKEPLFCLDCQNSFCKICITNWKQNNDTCPFRCKNPKFQKNNIISKILSLLKFKCKNGCGEEIMYDKLNEHYTEKCKKIDFKNMYLNLLNKFKEIQINNINYSNHPRFFKSKYHEHSLIYFSRIDDPIVLKKNHIVWMCNVCKCNGNDVKKVPSYYCSVCDFDLCLKCKIKNLLFKKFLSIFKIL